SSDVCSSDLTTAGKHQATFGNIRSQLGRRLLQGALDGRYNRTQRFLQSIENFVGIERKVTRNAFSQVTATHIDLAQLTTRVGTTNFFLDTFGRSFTDQATVMATNVGTDRFVEAVATNTDGFGIDHPIEGNDGDLTGAATNIDHHGTLGLFDRQPGTNSGRHRLFDQEHFAGTRTLGRFLDGATLYLRRHAGHTHQHARARRQECAL